MGAEIEVSSLFASLGLKLNKGEWGRGNQAITGMKSALTGLAAYFGGRFLGKALFGFNSTVEETKNQIAGMLALSKKTNLSDEAANAEKLYGNLQRRAASLPGTTQEYAQMLGMLTQPVTSAGLGLQDLEDLTVNAVVAAKGLGVEWEVAARDIDQALRGQFKSVDQLTGKLLASVGYAGEAGRAKFNAKSAKERASIVKAALTQKQITQLAEAQGKSFKGIVSTLQDAVQQFLGKVGIPLFKALGEVLKDATKWLEENKDAVADVATTIGDVLVGAFQAVGVAIGFFIEHSELGKSVLIALGIVIAAFAIKAAIAWVVAFAPIIAIIAGLTALAFVVMDVINVFQGGESKIAKAWNRLSGKLKTIAKVVALTLAAPFIGMYVAAVFFFEKIRSLPAKIVEAFKGVGEEIETFFGDAFDWIVAEAKKLPARIGNALEEFIVDGVFGEVPVPGAKAPSAPGPITRPGDSASTSKTTTNQVSFAPTMHFNGGDPQAIQKQLDEWWNTQVRDLEDIA